MLDAAQLDAMLRTGSLGHFGSSYSGIFAKSQPTAGDVHVNVPLTNISIAFMQDADNFIASQVFPNVPVTKQTDLYWSYDRGFWNRSEMEIRAPNAETRGIGYKLDANSSYSAPVYALHIDIEDQKRANADDPINLDRDATSILAMQALLKRELAFSTGFMKTGVWTTDITGVAGTPSTGQFKQYNDPNSTPIEDVRTGITTVMESTGFKPNKLTMGRRVYDKLVDHPDIVDRIKYSTSTNNQPSKANLNTLAQLFEVDQVLVMNAIQNTAAEGQANVHSFIGGKNMLLTFTPNGPGLLTPSAGYNFAWTGYTGAGADGQRIRRFRMEPLSSDRIEMEMAFVMKLVSADLGYFFSGAVA